MKKFIIFVLVITVLLFGCAVVMKKSPCGTEAAYQAGVTDAKSNKELKNNYAEFCPGNSVALNSAYHNGYISAILNEKHAISAGTPSTTATSSGHECLEAAGNKACGYHCMKSIKMVKCAKQPTDNCVGDNSGNIKCGINCRLETGHLKCDQER